MHSTDNILELINENLGFSTKLKCTVDQFSFQFILSSDPFKMLSYRD